jgi:predicted permease
MSLARQLHREPAETHVRTLWQDLAYGLRQLRKSPGFTTVAILTLALGIGANTAIFTLVHAIVLKPLPVNDPGSLYRLGTRIGDCCMSGGLQGEWDLFSTDLYKHFEQQTPEFEQLAAFEGRSTRISLRRPGDTAVARPARLEFVTGNYFPMFGLKASSGRLLSPADDQENAAPTAVMSYRTWVNYFAGDPSIVGSTLNFDGKAVTVVGIGPPDFFGDRLTATPADFWMPLATELLMEPAVAVLKAPPMHWLYVMGRLKPGVSPAQVEAKVNLELQQWLNSPQGATTIGEDDRSKIARQKTYMMPGAGGVNSLQSDAAPLLRLLSATAALVLLIACANIANLLLARGTARKSQIAIRLALGARRWRLARQLVTESVLLGVLGGAAGLGIAFLTARSILAVAFRGAEHIPINAEPSGAVLLFAFLLSLLTGVVFGTAPAWITSHGDPIEALRGNRTAAQGASFSQKLLVVCQAALSLVLVAGAILLAQSLRKLEQQHFGFQTAHRYVVHVSQAFQSFPAEQLPATYRELQSRLRAIPGVLTASYSLYSPMGGDNWSGSVYFPGRTPNFGQHGDHASWLRVSPNYFETVGTRLLRGRTINQQDNATSTRVAVVNEGFAKKFFPGEDPIGKHFGNQDTSHPSDWEIVGVVEDAKYKDAHGPAYVTYFLPYFQSAARGETADELVKSASNRLSTIELHVAGNPPNLENTVRNILAAMDPDATVQRFDTFDEEVQERLNMERLMSRLTLLFGLLALTLAAVGLYGVTAYTVERRTREIGVRVALGANRGNVIVMVLRGAFRPVAIGLVIGIALSLVAGRLIRSQLFEVKGHDPLALIGAALLLATFALIAGFVPARRAANIDPVSALRIE